MALYYDLPVFQEVYRLILMSPPQGQTPPFSEAFAVGVRLAVRYWRAIPPI